MYLLDRYEVCARQAQYVYRLSTCVIKIREVLYAMHVFMCYKLYLCIYVSSMFFACMLLINLGTETCVSMNVRLSCQ